MATKNTDTAAAAAESKGQPKNKPVNAVVPFEVRDALDAYATGKRVRIQSVVREAVESYYEQNRAEIDRVADAFRAIANG